MTPLGRDNLAIMADLSNPSNMKLLEDIFEDVYEDYKHEAHQVTTESFLSCYHQTDQGVIKIKE